LAYVGLIEIKHVTKGGVDLHKDRLFIFKTTSAIFGPNDNFIIH